MIFQSHSGGAGSAGGLARALAASFVLHLLLLWPALPANVPQRTAQPLAATLHPGAIPERSPSAAVAARPPEPVPRPRNVMRGKDAAISPAPFAPAAEAVAGATASMAAPSGPGGKAVAESSSSAAAAGALAPEQSGLDADGIRAYRIGLARGARAYKTYPLLARERGWAGTAEVRVAVSGEGLPRQVVLAHSSGHEVLDREAVNMMARAAADAAVPESLRGREFAVSLPVVFDLAPQ